MESIYKVTKAALDAYFFGKRKEKLRKVKYQNWPWYNVWENKANIRIMFINFLLHAKTWFKLCKHM